VFPSIVMFAPVSARMMAFVFVMGGGGADGAVRRFRGLRRRGGVAVDVLGGSGVGCVLSSILAC
jgi:hypothetical protein